MKKVISMLLILTMFTLAGCGSGKTSTDSTDSTESSGQVKVAMALADSSDYYIGTMVGEKVKGAFEETGADVQVLDAASDVVTQINQIQNSITSGADVIYLFPTGDGQTYEDVLKTAREAGVKTMVSHNYPGEGIADVYVGCDEFQMGAMMAAMVSEWVDTAYPEAGAGEVDVLIVESTFNENMIKRCLGMRLISEKFIREGDLATIYFKETEGDPVTYLDENGKEVPVDEPTGGLILDEKGQAQLNPYYNPKVNLVEYSNRSSAGTDLTEAQKAIENAVTMGYSDLKAVMSYGDVGAATETKMRELSGDGRISTSIDKMAVFCSDLTETNKELIMKSATNESVLRGVMASGDLVATLQKYAKALVNGEEVPAFTMEPLSYVTANDGGSDVESTYYTDSSQLPDTSKFFVD